MVGLETAAWGVEHLYDDLLGKPQFVVASRTPWTWSSARKPEPGPIFDVP
jgi:hypothetical protein